jgi:phage FluMu protein Com
MEWFEVECLRCGERHQLARVDGRRVLEAACPRCSYIGWAPCSGLTETARGALRERPVEKRRLHLV